MIHGHVRHYVGHVVRIQGRSDSGRAIWVSQNIIYYNSAVARVWVCLEPHFGVPCRTPEVNLHNRKHDVATLDGKYTICVFWWACVFVCFLCFLTGCVFRSQKHNDVLNIAPPMYAFGRLRDSPVSWICGLALLVRAVPKGRAIAQSTAELAAVPTSAPPRP